MANPPYVRITAPQDQYFLFIKAMSPYGTATSQGIEVVVADLCLETTYSIVDTVIELQLSVFGPGQTEIFDKPQAELET